MYIINDKKLIAEWDWEKNNILGLDPHNLVVGSNKRANWICIKCGNRWNAQIQKRGIRHQNCPICGKKNALEKRLKERLKKEGSLADNFPQLALEWCYGKNALTPQNVLAGSNKKVFWKCKDCGKIWEAQICKRTFRNQGCPICGQKKLKKSLEQYKNQRITTEGSFGSLHPDLLEEWDYELNDKSPYEYLEKSNVKVHWKCKRCGYKWLAPISNRTKGFGCIECGRKQAKETLLVNLIKKRGSLLDNDPVIASEWDYQKNVGVSPSDIMSNTNRFFWWKCSKCNYSWKTTVSNRTLGKGCPKCALIEHKIALSVPIKGINDLQSQAPDLAEEFHPTKNGELKPNCITRSSNKKIWWLGKCGHEWQATVGSRYMGRGCPKCLKEFKMSYPEKAIYYYVNKFFTNLTVIENYRPDCLLGKELDIYIKELRLGIEYDGLNWHKNLPNDNKKSNLCKANGINLLRIREQGLKNTQDEHCYIVKMTSDKDDNLIEAISYVLNFINKEYNLNNNYYIDLENDRKDIYSLLELNKKEHSIAAICPKVISEWHPTKNGYISPEYVNAHTHKKFWWICPKGHEYEMVVKYKIEKNCNCPICSSHRLLVGYNDLMTKFPKIAELWDYEKNSDLKPIDVMGTSNIKVWWTCENGHHYQRLISAQTSKTHECPICNSKQLAVGVNDLLTIYPHIADEWNYKLNSPFRPEHFTGISHRRVYWICKNCGNEWNISINSRCILGHGCPKCARKKRWETRRTQSISRNNEHN